MLPEQMVPDERLNFTIVPKMKSTYPNADIVIESTSEPFWKLN
jgi:hypothetical protein